MISFLFPMGTFIWSFYEKAAVGAAGLLYGFGAFICLRFGRLTFSVASSLGFLGVVPVTTDFSAWYSGYTVAILVVVLALAGWAFHTSLGGQKLFEGGLLDE